jgi:polyferredoxin
MNTDRIIVAVLMLAAVLWMRQRARHLHEDQRKKAMMGLMLFLIPALLGARWAFDHLPYGRYENLAIEIGGLAVIFTTVAFLFLNPKKISE